MSRQTILLKGEAIEDTGVAGGTVTPGDFLEMTATGWKRHSVAGGNFGAYAFAREARENQGAGISDNILVNQHLVALLVAPGVKVNARTADTIARGDLLTSAGDGTLRVRAAGETVVGQAAAANDGTRVEVIVGGSVEDVSV